MTTWRAFGALFGLILAVLPAAPALAGDDPVLVALGQWQVRSAKAQLVVPVEGALTTKQRSIINGGFTTVSQLILIKPHPGEEGDEDASEVRGTVVYKSRCSVKFDAWEETYDVARLDDKPRTALLHDLSQYADLCLKAEITDDKQLEPYKKAGGILVAVLIVKQMSSEEAARVKSWLIQQQSGVMQSLFSHMLGELTVNQTVRLKISIPPYEGGHAEPRPAKPGKLGKLDKIDLFGPGAPTSTTPAPTPPSGPRRKG